MTIDSATDRAPREESSRRSRKGGTWTGKTVKRQYRCERKYAIAMAGDTTVQPQDEIARRYEALIRVANSIRTQR